MTTRNARQREAGELANLQRRQTGAITALTERVECGLDSSAQAEGIEVLKQEWSNIRRTIPWR